MRREATRTIAEGIARELRSRGHTAYFAGGCVRDLLMNVKPKDYDIATTAVPDTIETIFPKCIPVGKKFGVMIVVLEGAQFEVATFRTEGGYQDARHPTQVSFTGPEEDARRRDFTVNGLFFDPVTKKVIDYVGGRRDIRDKRIRSIGDPRERFGEDHLRLLRAVRFAANLGFKIEPKTWAAVQTLAPQVRTVSQERIRDELVKMFTRPHAGRALALLSESGLLGQILPEVEQMKGVQQQPEFHPEGDVFRHTRLLLDQLVSPAPTLALGALFHDVGKPPTFACEDGRIHFYNHAQIGAEMTREIMSRLRFSNKEIETVAASVANHMKFADVKKMRLGKLKRFTMMENFAEELELHRIDCRASHGKLDLYRFLKKKVKEFEREAQAPKRVLNGHDLIAAGLAPGPVMKEILEEAYTLQLEGKIRTRAEALEWVTKHFLSGQGREEGEAT